MSDNTLTKIPEYPIDVKDLTPAPVNAVMLGTDPLIFTFTRKELPVYDYTTLLKIATLIGIDISSLTPGDRDQLLGRVNDYFKIDNNYDDFEIDNNYDDFEIELYKPTKDCGLILEKEFNIGQDNHPYMLLTLYDCGKMVHFQSFEKGKLETEEILSGEFMRITRSYTYGNSSNYLSEEEYHFPDYWIGKQIKQRDDKFFVVYKIDNLQVSKEEYDLRLKFGLSKLQQISQAAKGVITQESIPLDRIIYEYLFPQ